MGKKGSWFSAIKRVFTHNSKERPPTGSEKKSSKEKKKGKAILRHGETKPFIPLFREPSSIEKILGEADQLLIRPQETKAASPALFLKPKAASPKAASPRVSSARHNFSPKAVSPGASQNRKEIRYIHRPEPTLRNHHLSATKIQAAFRGYLARRNFRALRGLVRLQGVVRGQNVKKQTTNAMKQMQLLVRVQTQIQSRRIQMLENQAIQRQPYNNHNDMEGTLSKWTMNQLSEAGNDNDWDDSVLTKEEVEARLRKKVEAVIKRERSMAYAYSHQLWKENPRSAQSPIDTRSTGFPWWWSWLERQLPPASQAATKQATLTPPRPASDLKPSHIQSAATTPAPTSRKSTITPSATPPPSGNFMKHSKPRKGTAAAASSSSTYRDDDSLTSCPPFSGNVPNYMSPTVSAKAKARASSNPKERLIMGTTPVNESKRRFSFSLTANIGPFKWGKGSNKQDYASSQKGLMEKQYYQSSKCSINGDLSVDSAVSMPAIHVGRKPFNRFV